VRLSLACLMARDAVAGWCAEALACVCVSVGLVDGQGCCEGGSEGWSHELHALAMHCLAYEEESNE
jgi:hypothetical protein